MTDGGRLWLVAAALAAAGFALVLAARRRPDMVAGPDQAEAAEAADELTAPQPWTFTGWGVDLWARIEDAMTAPSGDAATLDHEQNVRAFLDAIAWAEGTAGSPNPYRVCFGYSHTIADLAEHPAVSGEWNGQRLPDAICQAAGKRPGCVSTAAGRYQIIKPTWEAVRDRLRLPDFGPDSQDAAAVELLREAGALDHIKAGRFSAAVQRSRRTWASLPASGWGQPERSAQAFAQAYQAAGGVITA